MKFKIALEAIFTLLLSYHAAAQLGDTSAAKVTFLYTQDPAPTGIRPIEKATFTGINPDSSCSYSELLLEAHRKAFSLMANLVKIDRHRARTTTQFCDEIVVSFYKIENIAAVERHFSWTADRQLNWEDFKGPVRYGVPPNIAAETAYSISVETSTVRGDKLPKVYVSNSFETATSWVRPGKATISVLTHEQLHWDICELYTRKMRAEISKIRITQYNFREAIRRSYQTLYTELHLRQQRYDDETTHGIDDEAQSRWGKIIKQELNGLQIYSSK